MMVLQCPVFLVSSPYPPNLHLPFGSTCNFSDENIIFVFKGFLLKEILYSIKSGLFNYGKINV